MSLHLNVSIVRSINKFGHAAGADVKSGVAGDELWARGFWEFASMRNNI